MARKYSISVVIPNYNGVELLRQNIPSILEALQVADVTYEIIVSDDASSDHSIDFLQTNYPEIKIVRNEINRGFSFTANAGIFAATKQLVFLVNSDVKLTGDYFSPQFKYFEAEDTFGVMGRIIGLDNDQIQDAAKTQYKTGLKIGSSENLIPAGENSDWFPTLYISGANALLNRTKLFELKGFEEAYAPFYGEDLDLSFRAWKVGWKCYYEHKSQCRHPNSITINKYNKKRKIKIIVYRNRFIMHAIHLSGFRKIMWNAWLSLQIIGKALTFRQEFIIAFKEYLKYSIQIKQARVNLSELGRKTGTLLQNEEVYKYIKIKHKSISHLKIK